MSSVIEIWFFYFEHFGGIILKIYVKHLFETLGEVALSDADKMKHCLNDLDVEAIKANPSAFTDENRIGPFLIGKLTVDVVKTWS